MRDLESLQTQPTDILVIGGGVTGAAAAWDAALRGFRVTLLERSDFGAATSAHSLKFAHGGIRYLQHLDIPRLRESRRERSNLIQIAPHCVGLIPVTVPCQGRGLGGRLAFRAALAAVRFLTLGTGPAVARSTHGRDVSGTMSAAQFRARFPQFPVRDLTGGAVFSDGHVYNPPRLVYSLVESARRLGARTINYCEVERIRTFRGRVVGVDAVDRVSGAELEIDAPVVLNCAGPYAEQLLVNAGLAENRSTSLSRDLAVVLRGSVSPGGAVAVQTRYTDPDAVLSRGRRHLFIVPWRGHTLVGVNSRQFRDDPYGVSITRDEVRGFLGEINEAAPALDLSLDDVTRLHYGLLPFGQNAEDATDLSFGKRSPLIDHEKRGGPQGLISAMSVRLTMGRAVAEAAVDRAERTLGRGRSVNTARTPALGGDFDSIDRALERARQILRANSDPVDEDAVEALVKNHGSATIGLRDLVSQNPGLAEHLPGSTVIEAEVVHAARHEAVVHLDDVVLRRTDLGTAARPEPAALERCATLVSDELGWSADRRAREIERVLTEYPDWIGSYARSDRSVDAVSGQ